MTSVKKGIVGMFALVFPLAYVIATAEPQNVKPGLAFDSVEIHAAAPNTMPHMRSRFGNGRYELHNATAVDLIRTAWGVDAAGIKHPLFGGWQNAYIVEGRPLPAPGTLSLVGLRLLGIGVATRRRVHLSA